MFLTGLKLKNFRNYSDFKIDFKSNKVLLIGKNAQGKTNILEAIYYLSALGSLRAKADTELILWGKDFCSIKGFVTKGSSSNVEKSAVNNDTGFDIELDVLINPPKKKVFKVNKIKKTKSCEFVSQLCTVSFTVNDLLLLRGMPDDRRSWLDFAISQIYPAYLDRLSKYNKIRLQKNNYLKELKGNISADLTLLDVLNSQMVIAGSNIIYLRLKFLSELVKTAKLKHKDISQSEDLSLQYASSVVDIFNFEKDDKGENLPEIAAIADLYEQKLAQRRNEEIFRGQSLVGSHRDDVLFFINGNDAKKFASQGQQRTIVLSLKLAELELISSKINDTPVLLLDDVLAELDSSRQNYLLNAISPNLQVIITSVDTLHFGKEFLEDVEIHTISSV